MPETETAEFWTADDDGYSREHVGATWTDDYGNQHMAQCDGTEECGVCDGSGLDPDDQEEPCPECDAATVVECTGCA